MNKPFFDPTLGAQRLDTVSASIAMTDTGLDTLVKYALIDPGLNERTPEEEIIDGARAAAKMNAIVITAIKATGVANDGTITADDVSALADWIIANRRADWITAHGDDENGVETGFHKIQNDGNTIYLFGDKMLDQVADGIYHLGFGYDGDRLINEDGDRNARLEEVAYWLNGLLADDLEAGTLKNAQVKADFQGTTGTGLDAVIDMINDDTGLERRLPAAEIKAGAQAANVMNEIIIDGIKALGLADDGTLEPSEVYALARWIEQNRFEPWIKAHGNDENNTETGFHLVQNDGSETRAFGKSGIDTVADGIYHLGFGYKDDRLINEDGNKNARVEDVTHWLNELLADDLANGSLTTGNGAPVSGSTGTGLDRLIDLISAESELNRRLPDQEIKAGATAANVMNEIIIEGIKATGIANDGQITRGDVMELANWIVANREASWIKAHGNDEKGVETGFHLVQSDGAKERLFDRNAVDTVADGLYHLGFGHKNGRVINEDGDGNATLADVAFWLEALLADDLQSGALTNSAVDLHPVGTTGTAFDALTQLITTDPGLTKRYSASDLQQIAQDVDTLNGILADAITATGVANDGSLTANELAVVSAWINENALNTWSKLRGDYDDADGILGLGWKGSVGDLGNANAINELGRAIYSLGFGTKHGGIQDQKGDWKGSLEDTAGYLNVLLADDLLAASFFNPAQDPVAPDTFASDIIASVGAVSVREDDNYATIKNTGALQLEDGTVAFTFSAREPDSGYQVLFAKDGKGSNDGDMRVYLWKGELHVKISVDGKDHYLKAEEPIKANDITDIAVTFDNGMVTLWVDGIREVVRADVDYDMRKNTSDVIVGAGNGNQEGNTTKIDGHFQGEITGFAVYDRALEQGEVQGLSAGSKVTGNNGDNNRAGTDGDDAMFGYLGRDVMLAGEGNDIVDGGYGADLVLGGKGDDILYGGEGQDSVDGGDGDDLIITDSDGREPQIGQLIYGSNGRVRDDNGWVDYNTLTIYPEQPVPANDVLTGGDGADTFRFQWNINAKDYIIKKHVREDGSINWRGVAGENTYLHDHWVDTIGDDVITDFSKAEGDRIEVAGHTLTLDYIEYKDVDGDGTDETIIAYKSNQGNGGAHDQDKLGTITVFGDKVTAADITQLPSMGVFYGVVDNVKYIKEAIKPLSIDAGTARALPGNLKTTTAEGPRGDAVEGPTAPANGYIKKAARTDTGLDTILDWIETDPGLLNQTSAKDIRKGSAAAAEMNAILVEAIKATGAANDGEIDAGDVYRMANWIKAKRKDAWLKAHGDDEGKTETGFHLVQNDGAVNDAYGRNSINTVADAIYHLGFGYKDDRLINEDGNKNERVESVAFWLNDLLAEDLKGDGLKNTKVKAPNDGTTGTGLDLLVQMIQTDPELSRRISDVEQQKGANAADAMNKTIVKHIKKLGLANDGEISGADVMRLAESIRKSDRKAWIEAHGDDEGKKETGFHLVQNDGAIGRLYGHNAIDTVADGLYHLGFGYNKNRQLINEDGNANASVDSVAYWLNELLADDMAKLANKKVDPTVDGSTGTGLDALVDIINDDAGLNRKVSLSEIQNGAEAADTMNQIIVQSIKATGVANDGRITAGDMMVLADFIKANHADMWIWAHGDDEKKKETGFHKVQNDGSETRLFGESAVDTVADGLYHLGFGHKDGRLINEDGNKNASLSDAASWLEELLAEDLAAGRLANGNKGPFQQGTTGTGLDALVEMVAIDEGLMAKLSTTDLDTAAKAADGLNKILLKSILKTGVANDGKIDAHDIKVMDAWIAANQAGPLNKLNGIENKNKRTGFEIAELWDSSSPLFGEDGINTVADSLYSIGYGVKYNDAISNRDGGWQAKLTDMADWLNTLLADDLAKGRFYSKANGYKNPETLADDVAVEAPRPVIGNGQGGYINIAHTKAQQLKQATVSFAFNANEIPDEGSAGLFSKDARDYGQGGHTSLYFYKGELHLRVQTKDKSHYLKITEKGALQAATNYTIALVLGETGVQAFVNGEQVASNLDIDATWAKNKEDIVVGGNGSSRKTGELDGVHSAFDGVISDFKVYDRALTYGEIGGIAGVNVDITRAPGTPKIDLSRTEPVKPPKQDTDVGSETPDEDQNAGVSDAMDAADLTETFGTSGGVHKGSKGIDVFVGMSGTNNFDGAAGNDLLIGGFQDDKLDGGNGNDTLIGDIKGSVFGGTDFLFGAKGDDLLQGGKGDDIFRFRPGDGNDTIADFDMAFPDAQAGIFDATPTGADFEVGADKIQLDGFTTLTQGNVLTSGALLQTADGTMFNAEGTSILIYGVGLNTLSESDFAFV